MINEYIKKCLSAWSLEIKKCEGENFPLVVMSIIGGFVAFFALMILMSMFTEESILCILWVITMLSAPHWLHSIYDNMKDSEKDSK